MKKNIFYTMQSAAVFFCTLIECCLTILLKIFREHVVVQKFLYYNILLVMSLFFSANSYGQDVGSSKVKANFGIDGDVYSGLFQFQPNPAPIVPVPGTNIDDWFKGATGKGVIDEVIPKSNPYSDLIPNPMTNTAFQRRQSEFIPNRLADNIPFPVVSSNGADYLWIDAVYGRDTYVKGGNAETSYFAGSGDKNSDHPNTWSIGTAGSVPQKDDIIDVYAHLRGTNPHDPTTNPGFPKDDRPFDSLYVYTAASLVVTNGNKHLDFEYFRTAASLVGNAIVNTGNDGGRTAWTFDATTGAVDIPGTIIVSVDYINGGNVPSIRIRVWMSQATFDAYDNTKPGRPFNVDKTVAFELGTGSGTFGYAAINPKTVGQYMWGRVNDDFSTYENSRTQAPPWDTWEGTTPTAVDMYTRYQFVEIGINLTAFGLDRRGESDNCSSILGSLMVKTRSSGGGPNEGAFGSELKDFAGPYLFGFIGSPPAITTQPITSCETGSTGAASINLNNGILTNPDSAVITFYNTLADAQNEVNAVTSPTSVTVASSPRTFYVRAERGQTNCFDTFQFDVTVTDNPDVTVQNLTACETGTTGAASVDLTTAILTNPDGGVISFYNSLADAQNEVNAVTSPTSVTVASSPRTFYIRAEAGTTNCYSTASFTVTVTDNPDITVQNLTACETGTTGAASVNLNNAILTNPDGGVISFYNSLADAQNEVNAVTSPMSVTVASSPRTFYIRAEAGTTNCYSTASFTVTVTDNPDITVQNLTACETGTTGAASVNLNNAILTNPDGGVISFYNSLADAQNEVNAVTSPTSVTVASSPRTFYIRAEAGTTNCYSTASFTVTVTDNPDITVQNLTTCETGTTGAASVNLMDAILTNPDGGVISFYNSLADAQNEVNAVTSPISVTVASSPRTFYIRAEAGTTNCYSTASFTVTITDKPDITVQNLTACETGTTGAASVNLMGAILTNPNGGVISFYNSLSDAQNEVNAVTSPISVTVLSSPRTFYIRAELGTTNCYSTASFTVTVTDNPDITVQNLTACETGTTGAASVDLTAAILTNPDGGVISFYNSLADAQNEVNAVTSPTSVTVLSSPRTFYIRAEAGTTNCYSTASFTVTVTDNPDITVQNLTACETGTTGAASVNLNNAILTNPDGGVISFYNSLADAQNEVNAVTSPTSVTVASSPRTFYIRAEAGTTNCYSTASFTVIVTDNPDITVQNLTACETGTTGAASVDLTAAILTNPDGGVISFYNSLADAQNEVNAVTSPTSVTVASSPRTFYIRAEAGTTNCYSTASFTVTVTDNPDITVQNLTACETGTTGAASVNLNNAILTNPDGGVISFYNSLADAQNEVNAVTSPISVTVASSPRTFYIRAEAGTTNCYSTASFTVIVTDNPDVTTTPLSSCESGSTGQATFTLNSGVTDADGGTLSFYTDVAMTNLISDENAGLTGVQYTTGSRTIYVKSVSGSCMGTAQFVITVNANPTCDITGEQTVCLGGSSTFTATAGMTTYAWTGPNNFSANTPSISVSVAGVYYVTITNANGCQSTCSRELMVVTCGGPICTYTQGAYGNSGGKYCDGTEGGIPTVDLITQALTNAGGTITVGKLGSSVVMSLGDENCIITQMPGGGKATEIVPAGDYDICPSLPNSFLKNGKINNVLLSQTIALSLNVNITNPSKLGNFELQAGTLATAKPEGGCGSEVAKPRVCGHFEGNIWVGTVNEYTYRTFSAAVINAIIPDGNGMKTIAGLLDLANRALANVDDVKNSEDGASLSDIAGAVAAVNEVFDECAIAVGWDIEKCPEPPTLDLATVTTAKISSVETAGFDAYPVPFKDQLTIKYNFDYVSDVTIEVFNSKGIIVYSMIDTNSYLGKEVVITINATLEQQQVYYVRLTTSQGSTVKSVMSSY